MHPQGGSMRVMGVILGSLHWSARHRRQSPGNRWPDTALATARGATFTAPTGWRVSPHADRTVLEPPEGDSHLAVVDVQAADAAAAVAAAGRATAPRRSGRSGSPRRRRLQRLGGAACLLVRDLAQ
jgi:hypothetical protein